ncbi:protein ACCELERATED CELL DEATH 6-like [Bidens hawaiensis]|uniref:protein ACCELERATED CELL DEATH 6-like n=1 Tax=Bidens hawaiensis TaxID=980011 RepID=UPI00404B7610
MLNIRDNRGWTPLHCALYHNSWLATTKLLGVDFTIGYLEILQNDDTLTSASHFSASLGHCEVLKVLMDLCPGCSEFIDSDGRNILHVAVENKKNKAIEFIFRDKSLTNLINQKDKNGNTPIHLLVASEFEKMETLIDSRVDINILNNENLTPLDMVSSDDQRKRLIKAITITLATSIQDKTSTLSPKINKSGTKEIEGEKIDKHFAIVDSLVVVAALIATASFAAAFTVPGGFNSSEGSKQGTPYLLKKSAFRAFVVTNAIAFSFSCSVLLGHIALVFYRNRYENASISVQEFIDGKIEDMYYLTTFALFAMTIAFVTGQYVVLTPSLGLAITVCVITLLIIVINMYKDSFGISSEAADPDVPSLLGRLLCR